LPALRGAGNLTRVPGNKSRARPPEGDEPALHPARKVFRLFPAQAKVRQSPSRLVRKRRHPVPGQITQGAGQIIPAAERVRHDANGHLSPIAQREAFAILDRYLFGAPEAG
jgi:hypothetical protein